MNIYDESWEAKVMEDGGDEKCSKERYRFQLKWIHF